MRIIRMDGTPDECVEQIKLNLSLIKKVTEVEIYMNEEDMPLLYRGITDISLYDGKLEESSKTYHLILRDTEWEQEVWVEGA